MAKIYKPRVAEKMLAVFYNRNVEFSVKISKPDSQGVRNRAQYGR